jgi:hypothetical protein
VSRPFITIFTSIRESPSRKRYRIYSRLLIIFGLAVAGYFFAVLMQQSRFLWALLPGIFVLGLSVLEFAIVDVLIDARFPPESQAFLDRLEDRAEQTDINNSIREVLSLQIGRLKGCNQERISAAVHLRVDVLSDFESGAVPGLIQLTDYTSHQLGGRKYRVLSPTKGIVGQCFRVGEAVWVNFRDLREYRERMVRDFGFTKDETEKHTKTGRSYYAYPLADGARQVGVLYLFSIDPQVFPVAVRGTEISDAATSIIQLLKTAEILRSSSASSTA